MKKSRILITGASSGIGEACAQRFSSQGHPLVLIARRADRLSALAKRIAQEHQVEVKSFALDVSDQTAVQQWAKKESPLLKDTQVLVNNAGLAKGLALLQEGNPDDWDTMIDTNLKGLLYITRAMLPHLIAHGSKAHIVQMGSVAGYWTYPKGGVYSATKFAVRSLTESLRLDLQGTGVRVTEIAPGMVETEFSSVRLGDEAKAKAVYAGMQPLTAADIAESVAWALDRPAHVNIQELVIYPTDQASPTQIVRTSN